MEGKFICFIGIDGSGKTTLINETIERFKKKGVKFNYVWGSYELFLLRPIVVWGKHLFFKNKDSGKDYKAYLSCVNKVGKSRFFSVCYQIAVFIEYLIQIYFKVGWPLLLKKNIISDRYVYDTIINIKVNLGLNEQRMYKMLRFLLKLVPAPDQIFFVDVPTETAFSRKADTPSLGYLKARRALFKKVAESQDAVYIDSTKSIGELYPLIETSIKKI